MMTERQKIFALTAGLLIFLTILRMVHRRKLREEYSWLWLLTGAGIIVLVVWYDLLVFLTELIGAVLPTTTLFLFGLLFLVLITLHYSIKISALTDQVKTLAQEIALLKAQAEDPPRPRAAGGEPDGPGPEKPPGARTPA